MAEARLLDGREAARTLKPVLAARFARLAAAGHRAQLVAVVAGDDPAVAAYARAKAKRAAELGAGFRVEQVGAAAGQPGLEATLARLSGDPAVHGVMLEVPVAPGMDDEAALRHLDPAKDVDGLTPLNQGLIAMGREDAALLPATPRACLVLAELEQPIAGKRAAVVGRGRAVGRALAAMLVNRDATVTICHSRTPDLAAALAGCSFVFVAAGRPGLIGRAQVQPGQVVIDAGTTMVEGTLQGDADAAAIAPVVAALTPVPGGVGALTSLLVFDNLLRAMALQGIPEASPEARS